MGWAIHLRIRVSAENRPAFEAFLAEAFPIYEAPGGIRMSLLEDPNDPTRLIEVVDYATEADYLADQERVENDPETKALLARWRALLDGPPEVEIYRTVVPGA